MHALVQALQYLNLAAFLILAGIGVRLVRRRREPEAFWAMLTFLSLALVVTLGRIVPEQPHGILEGAEQRTLIAILLLFPYLLYRFTTRFDPPTRTVERVLGAMTVAMIVWTYAQPSYPGAGEPRPPIFVAYLVAFLVHWSVLSAISSWRLWRVGRGQPGVARKRVRLLAVAALMLTAALFVTAVVGGEANLGTAISQALAFVSVVAFALGLAPPTALRLLWRMPEARRAQEAMESLITLATTRKQVLERVLEPLAAIVGADAVALRDAPGELLGTHNVAPEDVARLERGETPERALAIESPSGTLYVWTSPYAPFFGEEEIDVLRTMSALTWLALDRVRLFVQEHDARVALERANEVMTNFVALAAHELRTPVTTIHGFVYTLNHLGDRLSPDQREELSRTLEQQTSRMATLVEQLLDLSRLDAEVIEIVPQRVSVREHIAELVEATAAERQEEIDVRIEDGLEVELDPNAFERILSNLITNALRYGMPPVTVRAEQTDRHFRVFVEDRGGGVAPEFVPDLFERFTRGGEAGRERANGTGLGLAIARAYARAHGGDLLYEPAEPSGARFQFVLPVARRA